MKINLRFHWIMTFFIAVESLGGIIDAREHIQHGFELESFFTPSHYFLYAGWILSGIALVIHMAVRRSQGKTMREWLPQGYFASLAGVIIFGVGGGVDFIWHEMFGFEANLEAPISPGHTLLVIGAALMHAGVIFHGLYLRKRDPQKFSASINLMNLPTLISTVALLLKVLWPTWFLDPLLVDTPSGGIVAQQVHAYALLDYGIPVANAAGISGIFLMTLLTMPFILIPLHRWRMPVGSVTFIVTGYSLLRAIVGNAYIYLPATIGAALTADLIWAWMRASGEARLTSPTGYRLIAFFVPIVQYLLYFAVMYGLVGALVWSVPLWAGATFTTGCFSLLLSYALIKPSNSGVDALLFRTRILEA